MESLYTNTERTKHTLQN